MNVLWIVHFKSYLYCWLDFICLDFEQEI